MKFDKARGWLFALSFVFCTGCNPREDWSVQEFDALGFSVRSTYFHQANSFDTQCVQFESASGQSRAWHRFAEMCGDVAEDFGNHDWHVLGHDIAYLTYNGNVAVTTDAGQHWSVWYADQFSLCKAQKLACKSDWATVKITKQGIGSLVLEGNCVYPAIPCLKQFHLGTRDYGKTWQSN